jgi:hypothetical protein
MAIETDFEVQADGDVRYVGDAHGGALPGYYTVIEFHRWLQDLADDATASGDDLLDITDTTPSERSTDNIITFSPLTSDPAANATGSATWFRAFSSDGTSAIWDGSVGTSGATLNMNSTAIQINVQVDITSLTFTVNKG